MYQRNSVGADLTTEWSPCRALTGFLALTFGTLLSSQGAGAHRAEAFASFSGQPF